MRDSLNGNDNPVLMSRRVSVQSNFQMTQPLLCSGCERRFSELGESYVLPLLSRKKTFPLLDRLRIAMPLYATFQNSAFECPRVGLDGEKLGYFGLSLLWRAGVRPWRTFDKATTSVQLDANHLEKLRRYLSGETGWPINLAVIVTVATDFVSQQSCFVPFRVPDNPVFPTTYGTMIKGLYYRFVFQDNPPAALRAISVSGGGMNLIFARDCADKSWEPVASMMESTVPKGSLAKPMQGFAGKVREIDPATIQPSRH